MNISKGYRKLAMMLAVVMTAGSFAWGPGAELVYGATPESRLRVVHEEHGLRTGGGAPSPAVVSFDEATRRGSIFDGQVYMRCAMQTGTEETYTLSYPLKNNRTVELVLERPNMTNPPVMDVTYRLRDGSGNLISAAGADFRVYDHNLWESDEPFVAPVPGMFPNPENYRAFVNAAGSPAFRISVPTAGHGTDLFSPPVNFTGSPTAGFSFMFEGETIHFLWTTTHFEVATSGTVPGRFYSFDLQRQPAAGGGFRSTASFFAVPQPMFTAYSNVSPSVFPGVPRGDFDDPKVLPLDLDNAIYDDETYEVPRSRTGIEAEVSPGARRQQMHVTFPRPVMWNPADSSFTLAVDARINFTLQLTAPTRAPLRRIDINDVQSPTPSVPLAGQQWLAAFADGRFVQTTETALGADFTHMHTIIIDDMEPSTIYTAEFMPLGVMAGVSPRLVHIPHGAVYTLLHYVLFENYIEVLPYNSPGEYRLYQRGLRFSTAAPETNASWASNRTATGAESVIRMPYLVDELGARYYIINFRQQDIEGVIRSQQAHARLGEGTDLESPESFRINNAARADNLRRAENDFSGHSGLITMDFTLDLGLRNLFDDILLPMPVGNELLVSYEFNRSAVPDPDPDGACGNLVSFAGLDLRIERGIDALRTVTHVTASGLDTLVTATGLTVRLDSSVTPPRYFLDGRLVLNAVSPELEGFAQLAPSPMFIYPNVYFINVMPVEATVGGTTVWDRWHASPLTSLTLNNLVPPTLPPPVNPQVSENTSAAPEDKASVVYSFTVPAAQPGQTGHFGDYIGYYQPEIPSASMSALVSLYIAARENLFTQPDADGVTFNTLSAGERAAYARMTTVGADALTVDIATDSAHRVMINALREPNSRIVRIEGIDAGTLANVISTGVSITINGLDQNQQYFFYSDIEAEIEFPAGAVLPTPAAVELYKSNISALRSITTAGVPDIPDPGDRDPVAPNPFNIRGEPGDTNVTLEWRWSGVQLDGEQVEFEILRVRGEQMTNASGDSLLADRSVFPELWANSLAPNLTVKQDAATNPNSNHAMRTSGAGVMRWNPAAGVFVPVPDGDNTFFYPTTDPLGLGFTVYEDRTLTPNQIYFYYVRAVRITDEGERYSNWVHVSVTTSPVNRPTNLRIEPARPGFEYDRQTEIMFSFEAASNAGISFFYEIRPAGQQWREPLPLTEDMLVGTPAPIGTTGRYRFTYHVRQGLAQGTAYTVRVFAQDDASPPNNSLYSNEASFSTEINQEDYDRDHDLDGWQRYLRDLLDRLLRNPYWTLRDDGGTTELVYRPTMFNTQIVGALDANINLHQSDANRSIYYIPVSSFVSADNARKGFRVIHDNVEVIIPASVIDMNLNATIIDLHSKIKSGAIEDYYIRLSFDRRSVSVIDGAAPATLETAIGFDVLEKHSMTAERWDRNMLNQLTSEVALRIEDENVIYRLRSMIEGQEIAEDIILYIERIVEETMRDFSRSTLRPEFQSATGSQRAVAISRSYTVIGRNTATVNVGNGFEFTAGRWVQRSDTSPYGEGRAIYPNAPGTFIFAGRPSVIQSLVGTQDGAAMSALIHRHNLEDFFGPITHTSLDQLVNRDMLAGVVARIAGAPRGADSIAWLNQNRQLGLSTRNAQAPIETQEALYLVMVLYEARSNTPVTNIQVRNFAATANMQLDNRYRHHVRAAFELGIYTDRTMNPASPVRIREILRILVELDKRVRL